MATFCAFQCPAQTVEILAADQILRDPAITEAQRLIGNVVLGHEDGVLHCDSAWRYDNGQVDVFSNIRLNQPPSTVLTADFLQLDPESDWASASGQVQLQHEEASLEAPALAYQLASRQARYNAGAVIREDGWDVTSQSGTYLAEQQLLQLDMEHTLLPRTSIRLEELNETKNIRFIDENDHWTAKATMDFNDGHHMSIESANRFSQLLAETIQTGS